MSSVSDRMSRRHLASGSEVGTPATITLAELDRGQRAKVVGYGDEVEASTARRFFDLGIVPGIEVTMVRRAPLRDPVIFRVGDYEIALRTTQSRCIHVERVH
ncbi:ferrous iron transport protein A [Mycobacterium sp. NBC_00419]|uniref:FeoA family protein n=1 Tax=Mycobacterium sp. NBC_00419 TaxID=2975989 RepID=UPI002E24C200